MKYRFVNIFSAKLLTIIALVLSLVGQSMAYATMSCAMSMSGNMNHDSYMQTDVKMHHSDMDHSSIDHSGNDKSMHHTDMDHAPMNRAQMDHNSSDESHCGSECQCPESSCHSFSCLSDSAVLSTSSFPTNNFFALDQHNLDISLSSLYRPPIFA